MYLLTMEIKFKQFIGLWLIWLVYQRLPWSTAMNAKMEKDRADKDRPRIQVVDYVYKSNTLPNTNLVDSSPIVISGV